ncbi:MAG: calcium/sodium antiporter [Muricoprocola sp.]
MMIMCTLVLVMGFFALVKGADWFVNGSSALAENFHVSNLIIGLTIVALGTSAPELAVSTSAALVGANEIALSNVVGSNIFNLLGVLGICAIIYPLPVDKGVIKRDFPFAIITTGLLLILTSGAVFFGRQFAPYHMEQKIGTVTRMSGLLLVLLFVVYICFLIYAAKKYSVDEVSEPEKKKEPIWKCVFLIMIGLTMIIAGGQAVVYSAKKIARAAGMTETLIGLTIVAIGTSLPELVTSIVAARKGETGLAIGNVIGSNIFNLLFILGISALIHPIDVNVASVLDMIILLGISMLTFFFSLSSKRIARGEGVVMVLLYVADVIFAILR